MIYNINLNQYFYLKSEIDDLLANIDVGEIYTADDTTISISSEDVISVKPNVFADKSHTHTESEISNLGDYIEKSQTTGLVKNDGTIDTTEYIEEQDFGIQIDEDGILTVVPLSDANVYTGDLYATKSYVDNHLFSGSYDDLTDKPSIPDVSGKADKTGGVSQVTDGNASNYTNIGELSNGASQQAINSAINTKLGVLTGLEFIRVTSNKGSASADTMNKLIIEVGETTDAYYTIQNGNNYSWSKLDEDILDSLSINWSDIGNKPSSFTPSTHTHTTTDITNLSIPSDVSDLTDNSNTAFTPKTHTHTESQITDLGDYIEKSQTTGLVKNDGSIDTSSYLTSHQDITGKLDIAQTSYKGKNVVVDDTTGDITFEDKPTIPTVPSASSTTPSADTLNGDVGNGVTWARSNHKHPKSDLYAEASHNHNASDLDEIDTIEATITYTDDSTEIVDIYIKPVPPLNIKITIPSYMQVDSVKVYDASQNPQTEVASLSSNRTTLASGQTLNIPLGTYDIYLQSMAGTMHLKEAFVYNRNHTEFEFDSDDFKILS